jgi:hypothetical protein
MSMHVDALPLALLLASACNSGSGTAASGCDVAGVHYQEGQSYCCGSPSEDSPTPWGNTCICSNGAIESNGIFCTTGSDACAWANDAGGAESSTRD